MGDVQTPTCVGVNISVILSLIRLEVHQKLQKLLVRITVTHVAWTGTRPHASCGMDGNRPARPRPRAQKHGPHVRCVATPPALPRPGQTTRCPHDPAVPGLRSIPSLVCRHRPPPLEPRPPSPAISGCHGNQGRSVGRSHRKPHLNPPHPQPPPPTQPSRDDHLKPGEIYPSQPSQP